MRTRHCRLLGSLLGLFLAPAALASAWSEAVKPKVDEIIARNFKNQTQVGVVVGVVHGDETYVWSYGESVRGSGVAPTADTFFEMGSITKTFTNTLLALEVNRGTVHLGDSVSRFWPELAGTDAGAITLEELATHSSGLPRMPDNFAPSDPLNPYQDYDEGALLTFLRGFKQRETAPHASSYSNVGMGLLGHLLATKLNRLDYATYLQRELTGPLGLEDTKTALYRMDYRRVAQGYDSFFDLMPFWDLNVLAPAGALKTTPNDLIRYLRFNLNPGSSALGQAAELAQRPRATSDEKDARIGLAWYSMRLGTHSVTTHGGATGGYRANLIFDRENQLGIAVLSNTDISPRCVGAPVFEVECTVPEWKPTPLDLQARVIGTYRSAELNMNLVILSRNDVLGLEQDGYRMRLWQRTDLEFEIPDVGATLRFDLKEAGPAGQFTLLQNGSNIVFQRSADGEKPKAQTQAVKPRTEWR